MYKPSAYELNMLARLHVHKMYTRFFDVDWEEGSHQPIPLAAIQLPAKINDSFDIVPVVFITQKTIANIHERAIESLAKSIAGLVESLCKGSGIHPSEIQIDCDWTAGTKEIYFGLLNELKGQDYFRGKTLSCTIRMHQVKYTTTSGIPPADKGLLMCYSMGDIKKAGERNSILDADEAKEYLSRINIYPLPLDIALPLFRWCVLFRDEKFKGILHDLTPEQIGGNNLFSSTGNNLYRCKADTLWEGYSFKKNDIIRAESTSYEALMDVAGFTSQQIKRPDLNVLLFSCDSITLSKYSIDELESVYNIYR